MYKWKCVCIYMRLYFQRFSKIIINLLNIFNYNFRRCRWCWRLAQLRHRSRWILILSDENMRTSSQVRQLQSETTGQSACVQLLRTIGTEKTHSRYVCSSSSSSSTAPHVSWGCCKNVNETESRHVTFASVYFQNICIYIFLCQWR